MIRRRYVVEALEGRVLNSVTMADGGNVTELAGRRGNAIVVSANAQAELIDLDGVTIDANKGEMDGGDGEEIHVREGE